MFHGSCGLRQRSNHQLRRCWVVLLIDSIVHVKMFGFKVSLKRMVDSVSNITGLYRLTVISNHVASQQFMCAAVPSQMGEKKTPCIFVFPLHQEFQYARPSSHMGMPQHLSCQRGFELILAPQSACFLVTVVPEASVLRMPSHI